MKASSSSTAENSLSVTLALALGLCAGSCITLATTWLTQKSTNPTHPNISDKMNGKPPSSSKTSIPPEIRQEQLSRHTLYFGTDGMQRLQQARVCVVGLGGVGSHTAHMLARAGVGYLRLIDFDQVTLSSLNRHACAVLSDVGIPKAVCLERYLRQICPDEQYLKLDARVDMYTAESGPALLNLSNDDDDDDDDDDSGHDRQEKWDMVIDAIDDTTSKAALLAYCLQHKLRVISCMGAGGKADFTRLHCSDLRTATKDPLATKLRQELKRIMVNKNEAAAATATTTTTTTTTASNNDKTSKEQDSYLDDMNALTILYNSQKTVAKLADFTEDQKQQGVHQFGAVDGMRIRVIPVLGTMPAIMGQSLAALCLTELGGKPFHPVPAERVGKNVRNRLWQHASRREAGIVKQVLERKGLEKLPYPDGVVVDLSDTSTAPHRVWIGPIQIDQDDIEYLMEVWRNRCAVTDNKLGTVMHLVRWDLSKPSTCNNMVMVCNHALKQYDDESSGRIQKEKMPEYVRRRIESRLASMSRDAFGNA